MERLRRKKIFHICFSQNTWKKPSDSNFTVYTEELQIYITSQHREACDKSSKVLRIPAPFSFMVSFSLMENKINEMSAHLG